MFSGVVSVAGAPEFLAQVGASSGDDASARLTVVIFGLLLLAVVITIATVVFWRMTRPRPPDDAPAMRWSDRSTDAPDASDGDSTPAARAQDPSGRGIDP